jgi:Zn-dependent protease with chaperone function
LRVVDVHGKSTRGRATMASSSRKKTTMAKLNREAAVRERRARKKAKKDAREQAPVSPPDPFSDIPEIDDRVEAIEDESVSSSQSV